MSSRPDEHYDAADTAFRKACDEHDEADDEVDPFERPTKLRGRRGSMARLGESKRLFA